MRWMALAAAMALTGGAARADDPGFQPLFDGRTLAGWRVVGQGAWLVRDGEIACPGTGGSWLRTERQYGSFRLRLEYRIPPGANSGIFVRVPENGRSSRQGFEVQILDDFGKPPSVTGTGSLYQVVAPTVNASRPAGEWNEMEITCDGPRIRIVLNGVAVIDTRADDAALNAARAVLFKPALRSRRGYIGLQDHGAGVRFRNLRIHELPPADARPALDLD